MEIIDTKRWHRIVVLKQRLEDGTMEMRFVHPAPVGKQSAGWMEVCAPFVISIYLLQLMQHVHSL